MARRSDIERVAAEYRARLAALEARYTRAVGEPRRRAARALNDQLALFLDEITTTGLPDRVTRQWLTDLPAYQRLVAVAHAGMDDVAAEAVRAIQWRIADAAALGKPAADQLTAVSIGDDGPRLAAQGAFGQVNTAAVTELVGQLQASSPLRALPDLGGEAIQRMQSELLRGLANGEHSRTIGRRIAQATEMPAARAATIARTEIHRAYREANRIAFDANPMVGQWRWQAGLGARTCSSCWAMHGTVHSNDEAMGTHPNCRCAMLPVVDAGKLREIGIDAPDITWPTGEDLFAKQPAKVQLAVLGPEKFREYRRGRIRLADTVAVRRTREWGTTRSVGSARDAVQRAQARTTTTPRTRRVDVPDPRRHSDPAVNQLRDTPAWKAAWRDAHEQMAAADRRPAPYLIDSLLDDDKAGRRWLASHYGDIALTTRTRRPDLEPEGGREVRWYVPVTDPDGHRRIARVVLDTVNDEISHVFPDRGRRP